MCTFADIQKANNAIKTTPIKEKEYAEVNQRIKAFRMVHPMGAIETDLVSIDNGVCIFRAIIKDADSKILGTGTAYEKEGSTFINKTSYIENCETSAVGRALAMCGFGIDTSIASAEEVQNAQANQQGTARAERANKHTQKAKPKNSSSASVKPNTDDLTPLGKLLLLLKGNNIAEEDACVSLQVDKLEDLSNGKIRYVIDHFGELVEAIERRRGSAVS